MTSKYYCACSPIKRMRQRRRSDMRFSITGESGVRGAERANEFAAADTIYNFLTLTAG